MEEIKKPVKTIVLQMADFRNALVALVNNSGLPTPVSYMIVKEMATALEGPAEQYYQNERAAYEALLKENANDVRSN